MCSYIAQLITEMLSAMWTSLTVKRHISHPFYNYLGGKRKNNLQIGTHSYFKRFCSAEPNS